MRPAPANLREATDKTVESRLALGLEVAPVSIEKWIDLIESDSEVALAAAVKGVQPRER